MRLVLFECIRSQFTGLRVSTWVCQEHLKLRPFAYFDKDISMKGRIHRPSFWNVLSVQLAQKLRFSWVRVANKQDNVLFVGIYVDHAARAGIFLSSVSAFQKLHSRCPKIEDPDRRMVQHMASSRRQLIDFSRERGLFLCSGLTRVVDIFHLFWCLTILVERNGGSIFSLFGIEEAHGVGRVDAVVMTPLTIFMRSGKNISLVDSLLKLLFLDLFLKWTWSWLTQYGRFSCSTPSSVVVFSCRVGAPGKIWRRTGL